MTDMTLTTHAVVGTAAAVAADAAFGFSVTPLVLSASALAAFMSHFAADAIPHWNEGQLLSSIVEDSNDPLNIDMKLNKQFVRDLGILATDALLGLLASVV